MDSPMSESEIKRCMRAIQRKGKRLRYWRRQAARVAQRPWIGLPHVAKPRQRERGTYTAMLVTACNGGHDFHGT
jgi:hypothetical protein